MGKIKDRTNETRLNNNGEEMKIVRYGGNADIDIQFVKDGTLIEHRTYDDFKNGRIKNPMTPSVYGVGYFGIGKFKTCDENGKRTKCYTVWEHMMERCYDPKYKEKRPTYKGCRVCEEWHNFQVFAEWYYEHYYELENEKMALDKDILKKGNKVYSPETCVFVPVSINSLFIKSNKTRGKYPIGVCKERNKFAVWLNKGIGKPMRLGSYSTPELAFQVYKQAKEEYIKQVANEYKLQIPHNLYEALMNYKVEIDD